MKSNGNKVKKTIPEKPPTAKSFPSMTATLMLARQDVIDGPGDHVFVSKSNISVVHKDWQPSEPPTTHNLSEGNKKIISHGSENKQETKRVGIIRDRNQRKPILL